ncbi:MAG TPA: hypothetical protein DCZ94_15680 [Lentisphaeria bacterium]|nr:MAG: hypothetical protein A2X48_16935 [Lentisphaerae bacterium GWF2_49_21]HBC88389.1 hypothetical protein [Lentisphaeria bacterium]
MRILKHEEIQSCATGCLDWKSDSKGFSAVRFPQPVMDFYGQSEGSRIRAECPAGVVLDFTTDSLTIRVCGEFGEGARKYASIDLIEDEELVDIIEIPENAPMADGVLRGSRAGLRRCRIYLPHVRSFHIRSIELEEGSQFNPSAHRPVLLALGDSITQGMNALHPALTYPALTARLMDMTLYNGGIGGARFNAASIPEILVANPELILVAYGTNDWKGGQSPENAKAYLRQLRNLYPQVPIVLLEPIFRAISLQANPEGLTLADYRARLRGIAGKLQGVRVIPSEKLLPPSEEWLSDGTHPGCGGHLLYGLNLAALLKASPEILPAS